MLNGIDVEGESARWRYKVQKLMLGSWILLGISQVTLLIPDILSLTLEVPMQGVVSSESFG